MDAKNFEYLSKKVDRYEKLDKLRDIAKTKKITLLFAAKDITINNAVVIRDVLMGK